MNIDMAALHAIETDRGIAEGELLDTIKSALMTAYRHTEGHQPDASIDIDRKSGAVRVMARELDADGHSSASRISRHFCHQRAARPPVCDGFGGKSLGRCRLLFQSHGRR